MRRLHIEYDLSIYWVIEDSLDTFWKLHSSYEAKEQLRWLAMFNLQQNWAGGGFSHRSRKPPNPCPTRTQWPVVCEKGWTPKALTVLWIWDKQGDFFFCASRESNSWAGSHHRLLPAGLKPACKTAEAKEQLRWLACLISSKTDQQCCSQGWRLNKDIISCAIFAFC